MATARPTPEANGPRRRILRIGVILGGKIVEERLIRDRDKDVTIGQSAKNTFSVPIEGLPRTWPLFQAHEGNYILRFTDTMDGRISGGDGVATLGQLKSHGARRADDHWMAPLGDTARGKIVVGDMTLLFQFVTEPPLQPKPHLPASVRGTLADRIEPQLAVILLASLLFHGIAGGYFTCVRDPVVSGRSEKVYKRTFDQPVAVSKEPIEQPLELDKEDTSSDDEGEAEDEADEQPEEKQTSEPKKQRPQLSEEEKARQRERELLDAREQYKKAMGIATSSRESEHGVGGADADVTGDNVDRQLEELQKRGGAPSLENDKRNDLRGDGPKLGDKAKDDRKDASDVARDDKRKVAKAKVSIGGATGDRDAKTLTPQDVSKRIQQMYMAGLRRCHSQALKSDPSAGGRVKLSFTVTESGRVASADARGFSSSVDSCIESQMGTWRFPPPKDEDGDTFDARYQITLALQAPT